MLRPLRAAGLRAVEESLQVLLEVGEIDLDGFQGICDLLEADLLVRLGRTIEVELVTVLLNDLATVSNLVEAKGSRGSLEEVTKTR